MSLRLSLMIKNRKVDTDLSKTVNKTEKPGTDSHI